MHISPCQGSLRQKKSYSVQTLQEGQTQTQDKYLVWNETKQRPFQEQLTPDKGTAAERMSLVRLVPVSFEDPDFLASYEQSAALYARYQMAIHGDSPFECDESQFKRFLCDSPLELVQPQKSSISLYVPLYAGFLTVPAPPACEANPSSSGLSCFREIAFTRQLQKQSPKLSYYYLGFYIHSCPKMRYKVGLSSPHLALLQLPATFLLWSSSY
ncbi:hypothetical protein AOLI_G00027240 [Acnodon oligacanthus]